MLRLRRYLAAYRKECALAPLFKLLEAGFELLVPLVMAAIIDRGVALRDQGLVLRLGAVLAALGLVGLMSAVTAQYFAAKAAVGFSAAVRSALFKHIQSFSYAELDAQGTPTLITRMTADMNNAQNGVNMFLRLVLRSPFIVFGAAAMAFVVDARAALVFAGLIPLLFAAVALVMGAALPRHRRAQRQSDAVLGLVRENLTGARVVRAFHLQKQEYARFADSGALLSRFQMLAGRLSALMNPLTYALVNAALVALIWTGALRVDAGAISQGALVALVNYMSQILVELVKFANLIVTLTRANASAQRIADTLSSKASEGYDEARAGASARADDGASPAIVFSHVGFTYPGGGAAALSDVSFAIRRGESVGVLGGTGSGKSTLLNLIPRFYEASDGEVDVLGRDVRAQDSAMLRARVGVVAQRAALFRGTIRDNLRWGAPDATDDELWAALAAAQAEQIVRDKPAGLDEMIEQRGRNLSGGQKQRLSIARALARKPEILLLDDSFSALDYATEAALLHAIAAMTGVTRVLVSQRASSVRLCDRVLVLDDGRLVGDGTHDELMADCPVYREIYYTQYPKEAAL